MSIFEVGRICVKLAGRDAGRKCVIVEELDNHYVLVDGDVRRKKVNICHLEPLEEMLDIKLVAMSFKVLAYLILWRITISLFIISEYNDCR